MRRSIEGLGADTQALPALVELVDQTAEWGRGPSVPRISSPIHRKCEPLASRRRASRPSATYSSVTSGLVIGLPSWWATPTLRNFMASSWMLGAIEPSMALHPGSAGEKDALQDRGVRHPRLADVEHNVDRPARLEHRKANAADLLGRRGSTTAATCAPRASLARSTTNRPCDALHQPVLRCCDAALGTPPTCFGAFVAGFFLASETRWRRFAHRTECEGCIAVMMIKSSNARDAVGKAHHGAPPYPCCRSGSAV